MNSIAKLLHKENKTLKLSEYHHLKNLQLMPSGGLLLSYFLNSVCHIFLSLHMWQFLMNTLGILELGYIVNFTSLSIKKYVSLDRWYGIGETLIILGASHLLTPTFLNLLYGTIKRQLKSVVVRVVNLMESRTSGVMDLSTHQRQFSWTKKLCIAPFSNCDPDSIKQREKDIC